jgi:hypothetical protein
MIEFSGIRGTVSMRAADPALQGAFVPPVK